MESRVAERILQLTRVHHSEDPWSLWVLEGRYTG